MLRIMNLPAIGDENSRMGGRKDGNISAVSQATPKWTADLSPSSSNSTVE
jgi:hypothetical protein